MANLDRAGFIELLARLGAQSDEEALKAARELHRNVIEAGVSWDELLRPEDEPEEESHAVSDAPLQEEDAEEDAEEEVEEAAADEEVKPDKGRKPAGDRAEDARIIDRLLTRKNLSKEMRDELTQLKSMIKDGTFEKMDSDYVRALAKRLGA